MMYLRVIVLLWIAVGLNTTRVFSQKLAGTIYYNDKAQPGYTLFTTLNTQNTYLIDNCGNVVNRWQSEHRSGSTAYLLNNGNMVRAVNLPNVPLNRGGGGGGIEMMDWNSKIIWSFTYNTPLARQHHDILPLPGGNILVLAWQVRSKDEAIAAGRDPVTIADGVIWSEEIIEVKPVYPTGFEIVWKWNLWDHLVQDYDATKSNHGVVAEHPELVDLNFGDGNDDWVHLNALGYNEDLDQIMVSTPIFDELWVIDHSTTTAQAATHAGGRSNKGGDLLYRWGNPLTYRKGTEQDATINGVHNAHWIKKGLPHAGEIILFHNRAGTNYSTVEIITPPLNSAGTYDLQNGRFGPAMASFTFKANPPTNLNSGNQAGAQMQPNGNVLICSSNQGRFVELTPSLDTAWIYKSPITIDGIAGITFTPANADFKSDGSFRAMKFTPDHPALAGKNLATGESIEGGITKCQEVVTAVTAHREDAVRVYPNPVSDYVVVESTDPFGELNVRLVDLQGREVVREHGCGTLHINTSLLPDGLFIVQVNNHSTRIIKRGQVK